MEITVTEFVLFVWAVVATIGMFHSNAELTSAKKFVTHLIDDPKLYEDLRNSLNALKERHHVNGL